MKLYNTLTKNIDDIKPLEVGKIKAFVCGPTVYDYVHIGNAKTYTQSDMLMRYLRYAGFDVTYLQNITDIDDKIIKRAAENNETVTALTERFTKAYFEDMENLGNTAVSMYAKATDHIADIIKQVTVLMEKGFAYPTSDGIYFEISKFSEYGKLSNRQNVEEDDAQSRIDESDEKRGWNDFCLWKFSKPGEPVWEAPFGDGRPGWHIEDTAITEHFFGPQYDIHGGAIDLIFPHHEAEITQMEAASGLSPFVGHWFHVGFLTVNDKRMGKSVGNFSTLREVFEKGYSASTIRLFFMQAHYRKGLNFTWENLDAAYNRLQNWREALVLRWQPIDNNTPNNAAHYEETMNSIVAALENDFDTPTALKYFEEALDKARQGISSKELESFYKLIQAFDAIFNLNLAAITPDISDSLKAAIQRRQAAKDAKDWTTADTIREELSKDGISLKDTPKGQFWYYL